MNFVKSRVTCLLSALILGTSLTSPARAEGSESGFRLEVEYHGLPGSRRLLGTPVRQSSLGAVLSLPAARYFVAASAREPVSLPPAGISIAQAIPVFPGARGCGLLTVHLPVTDPNLNSLDQNPARLDVKRLVTSSEFDELDDPERSELWQGWTALEGMFDALTALAGELATGMTSAIHRVGQLETQACNLAQEYTRVQPDLDRFKVVCRGTLPDDTYNWCMNERRRLKPEAEALEIGDRAMKDAVQEFAARHSIPLTDKKDSANQVYAGWQRGLNEHKSKVKAALNRRNPKCRNTVNIHIQENGFPTHQPYQDAIPNAVDATAEEAVNYLNLVSNAFYLRKNGTKDVKGLGAATVAGRVFLGSVSTPPPAIRPPLYFAPGPPSNAASTWRFDITISGRYPCPKRPVVSMSAIDHE